MLIALLQLGGGLVILFVGGHYLVVAATRIALLARISAAVVGLTVVAMGTSMPELAVSLGAVLRKAPDISYSNIVGSNIFNLAVILALTAIVRVVPVERQTIRLEYPFMVIATWVTVLLTRDGLVDRLEGAFLLFSLGAFTVYMVRLSRSETSSAAVTGLAQSVSQVAAADERRRAWGKNILLALGGIAALALGADLIVRGAVTFAETYAVSQRVIGLTIIAMGTSLPELATSIVAARRGESAIAVGNIVGSNIFNLLCILGTTSVVIPISVNPQALAVDNWVMLGITMALFPLILWGRNVTRWNGVLLLAIFGVYLGYLIRTG